ncbi:respiratory nitrate reductase subunit gamma [Myxococcaceae bacterium GXIMD 01537]
MNETFLYGYLPYAAVLAAGVGVSRLVQSCRRGACPAPRAWDAGSRMLLVGAVVVALNHLPALLLPGVLRSLLAHPTRLFLFEAVSLIGGLLFGLGLVQRVLATLREGLGSWVVAAYSGALLFVVLSGLHIAVTMRWGAAWGLHVVGPYLRSLAVLSPDTTLLAEAPWLLRAHAMAGFLALALAPFARMAAARAPVRPMHSAEEPALPATRQEIAP